MDELTSVAAYRMKADLARLFPMMARVKANTVRSIGFKAWIALCASYTCLLMSL